MDKIGARYYVCPDCGSMDIAGDTIPQMGQHFRCNACGKDTPAIIEADSLEDARRFQEQIRASD